MTAHIGRILNAPGIAANTILQALGKVAPKLVPFVSGATAAGYGADQVLDFLKNKFTSPSEKRERAMLESRANTGVSRPDENAALTRHEQRAAPIETAQQALRLGSQAAGGLGALGAANQAQADEVQQMQQAQEQALAAQAQQQAQYAQSQQSIQTRHEQNLAVRRESLDIRKAQQQAKATPNPINISPQEMTKMKTIADSIVQSGASKADVGKALKSLKFDKKAVDQLVAQLDHGNEHDAVEQALIAAINQRIGKK